MSRLSVRRTLIAPLAFFMALAVATPCAQAEPPSPAKSSKPDAVVFVVDSSGSMDGRQQAVRKALESAITTLDEEDLVAVLAFDDQPRPLLRFQPAGEAVGALADFRVGGGTEIQPALIWAFYAIDLIDAERKQIVLMSDGNSPYDEILAWADAAKAREIPIHTVALGEGADTELLSVIAEKSSGKTTVAEDADGLEDIFVEHTSKFAEK